MKLKFRCRSQEDFEKSFISLRDDLVSDIKLWETDPEYLHKLDLLENILPDLTYKQRCYIFLVQLGRKDVEIAQIMHISKRAIRSLRLRTIRKARKLLRKNKLIPISFANAVQ